MRAVGGLDIAIIYTIKVRQFDSCLTTSSFLRTFVLSQAFKGHTCRPRELPCFHQDHMLRRICRP